ncbi:rRNA maturation RNase YbeY [Ventosimonas gracilis]|uniref:Endoribonuclease YbeY n=1 Tax=Ventosimonas gracilis TaxID=1680762 RepID=A0A139SJT4_9GAMM|nr:rRNA maturation RNase YbeY [Ventosimonas gracilis]KXU34838.1 rRNA maturation RNase YbeY [Ventosimonas gracilis]
MSELCIELHNHSRLTVPDEALFRRCCAAALSERKPPLELEISLLDEEPARAINMAFRGRDYATNVLSFPFEPLPGVDLPILGELILCPAVIEREAIEQGKSAQAHWAHLLIHGCLHLLGYDHEQELQAQRMENRERELLADLGYPDPYQDEQ